MKICVLTLDLNTLGGVQTVVSRILKDIKAQCGWEIDILSPVEKNSGVQLISSSDFNIIDLYSVISKRVGKLRQRLLGVNRRTAILSHRCFDRFVEELYFPQKERQKLIAFLRKKKYNAIIGVTDRYTLYVSMIAPFLNCQVLGWEHSTYEAYFHKKNFASYGLESIFERNAKNLDGIMVLTEVDAEKFQEHSKTEVTVVYNPSFMEFFGKKTFSKEVLWVGRLAKEVKGLDYLIEIIKKAIAIDDDLTFTIVGDGKDRVYFEKEIQEQNLLPYIIIVLVC